MQLIKYAIFYTYVGVYESSLLVKLGVLKIKSLFSSDLTIKKNASTTPQRIKGALLKTAFRSIL